MELIDQSLITLLLLVLVAMIAGFIDTLVGGGGLITIPALLMAGLPPVFALGTNKLQASAGTATASYILLKKGLFSWHKVRFFMLIAFVGSVMGTLLVQFIDTSVLSWLIPCVIISIAVYFVFAPSVTKKTPVTKNSRLYYGAVPAIGFYDGMFGPATGSFFVLAGVSIKGQDIIGATVVAKTLNFATNIASLLTFSMLGNVLWVIGLPMMIGQIIGAKFGSSVLLEINPNWLRWLVVAMALVMLVVWWLT